MTTTATSTAAAKSVTVMDNYGEKTVQLPVERPVSLDNRTFAVLDAWGVKLKAAPRALMAGGNLSYKDDESVVNIGNHREPNLEAIVEVNPDVIVGGQRFVKYDEEIQKMNPQATFVQFDPRPDEPLDKELIREVEELGKIFGKEAEAKMMVDDFNKAIERVKKAYNGTDTVMTVNVSGGNIGFIAPGKGRTYGPLYQILGWKPALEVAGATSNHKGDDISVEAIAESNPDWIFVMDRDAAIASKKPEFVPAQKVIADSAPLQNVTAVKNSHVYIAPGKTYTDESIITYTEILNQIADMFEAAKK